MASLTQEIRGNDPSAVGSAGVDMKIEVIVIPVSDVDRAKEFYGRLGWRLDQTPPGVVQLTPHGSASSVQFGAKLTSATPGSGKGYAIVSDIVAARNALLASGVKVGEIFHLGPDGPVPGPDPEHRTYRSRAPSVIPTATATGGHLPPSRTHRRWSDFVRLGKRSGERSAACRSCARTARGADGASRQTGRIGTPSTWCASRTAKNCRNEPRRFHFQETELVGHPAGSEGETAVVFRAP